MSLRTENQVAEMKKQTIGVEVEMNSITREKAARLAATFFGTGRYENTACRNGYCTWSAWDESGREWKFQKDVSIAGPDSEKCEMVTPILTYVDMETLQELVRRLRKAGAKSDATRGCGVHIHIGAKGHTPQTLRNLANIMASHEDLLASALNLDRGRISRYCRTVDPRFLERLNNRKPTTMAALADIWYGSQNADYGRSQHYNDSRYHMATIGLDRLYYAKITENDAGEETYGTPEQLAKAISADLSVELAEATLYADDGASEIVKEFKSGTLSLGIDDIGSAAASDLTGATIDKNKVLISASEDGGDPVAVGFRAKKSNGKYKYYWLYRVKFGIPATNLATKGDSITFSTPTIEGTILRRNKADAGGKHPWKAEALEGDVTAATITNWYKEVYEPTYTTTPEKQG